MKHLSVLLVAALLAVVVLTSLTTKSHADPQARKVYDYVIVQGYPDFKQFVTNNYASYQWNGCFVYNYDGSKGAPEMDLPVTGGDLFGATTNKLAQTLSDLSNQGFELINSGENTSQLTFILRRLRIHP